MSSVFRAGPTAKYWEITLVGKKVIVRYGKIGTDGQLSPKEFESKEEAETFVAKKIKEKTKEGYIEKPSPHAYLVSVLTIIRGRFKKEGGASIPCQTCLLQW